MKICKNCKKQIEDDALVCPYCGCVNKNDTVKSDRSKGSEIARNTGSEEPQKKKRKTWLWVIGWIFAFPIPLTLLMIRNQKLNKILKIIIIVIAWLFYLLIVSSFGGNNKDVTETTSNIKKLEFTSTKDITVKVGKSDSNGYLKVSVKKKNEFVPEDVVFVSENPEIADISFSKVSGSTMLYYDITGVDGGETNVYATSKDGSVKSESIHVVVPMPIKVETVQIEEVEETDLYIGETIKTKVTVAPSDAEDKTITWTSSDEGVATVDEKGIVTAVGGGEATIKAASSNGVEDSFDISVDGSKTLMNLMVRHPREDDVSIGDEWSYDIEIDGERPSKTIGVAAGDTLSFSATITESDDSPDTGTGSTSYTVTEDDIENGFEVAFDVYVTENGGRNSGQSAHFVVTFTFSPVE